MTHNAFKIRGFTLIELLVTMGVFTLVIVIASGALFSAQAINTRLEQTQTILDGMNLTTELVVRDIRYGSNFYCSSGSSVPTPVPTTRQDCPYSTGGGGGSVLVFRPTLALSGSSDPTQDRVAYYVNNGTLYKNEYPSGGAVRTYQITTTDVNVSSLKFYAKGTKNSGDASADYNQPVITIAISGRTIPTKRTVQPITFNIETTASTRTLDQ